MSEATERVVAVLEALDELVNAAMGPVTNIPAAGDPRATVSQRLGQMLIYGTPRQQEVARFCDHILTAIENKVFGGDTQSHCLDSIKGL
jgi:hypothetical protein